MYSNVQYLQCTAPEHMLWKTYLPLFEVHNEWSARYARNGYDSISHQHEYGRTPLKYYRKPLTYRTVPAHSHL